MTLKTRCAARQYSDEMHCAECRLKWDTNDPDPPPCGRAQRIEPQPPGVLEPVMAPLGFASGLPAHFR